jgi:anti-anti-sigma factor
VIATNGYVNNHGGEQIADEFEKHFAEGIKKIIINLAKSKVVNSIGISFLIEIIEKLNEVGGKLYFTNLDASIEKTLTIMGLFNFAEKTATVDEAVKALN